MSLRRQVSIRTMESSEDMAESVYHCTPHSFTLHHLLSLPFKGVVHSIVIIMQVAAEVGDTAAVLGFVGAPFTLATYIVEVDPDSNTSSKCGVKCDVKCDIFEGDIHWIQRSNKGSLRLWPPPQGPPVSRHTHAFLHTTITQGGTSKDFENIKRMAFTQPDTLHLLLDKLADNIADYCRYQVGGWVGGPLDVGLSFSMAFYTEQQVEAYQPPPWLLYLTRSQLYVLNCLFSFLANPTATTPPHSPYTRRTTVRTSSRSSTRGRAT